MTIVHRKLGNGFVVKDTDSIKDQSHYFDGAKKFIKLNFQYGLPVETDVFMTASSNVTTAQGAAMTDIVTDSTGTLFASYHTYIETTGRIDDGYTAASAHQACILKSTDKGLNWTPVDFSGSLWNGMYVDPRTDNIYAFGMGRNSRWTTRRSTSHGTSGSWVTLDNYPQITLASIAYCGCVTVSGTILVGGTARAGGAPNKIWVVRSSSDNGTTWADVDILTGSSQNNGVCFDMAVSADDFVYAIGTCDNEGGRWLVRQSHGTVSASVAVGATASWATADHFDGVSANTNGFGVAIDSDRNVYTCGARDNAATGLNWLVRRAHVTSALGTWIDADEFSGSYQSFFGKGLARARKITVDGNNPNIVYAVGGTDMDFETNTKTWTIKRSIDQGNTWQFITNADRNTQYAGVAFSGNTLAERGDVYNVCSLQQGTNGAFLACGTLTGVFPGISTVPVTPALMRRYSGFGTYIPFSASVGQRNIVLEFMPQLTDANGVVLDTGSFVPNVLGVDPDTYVDIYNAKFRFDIATGSAEQFTGSAIDPKNIYIAFRDRNSTLWTTYRDLKGKGTFTKLDSKHSRYEFGFLTGSVVSYPKVRFNNKDIMVMFSASSGSYGLKNIVLEFNYPLNSNAVSYYKTLDNQNNEDLFSSYNFGIKRGFEESKNLKDSIAEFQHGGGLFQMRNVILGTSDKGKIGKTTDNIIQVNYIGSVVHVMFPKQADVDYRIKGFGDLAPGQRIGKLTNTFQSGEFYDVSEFDHLSLYCMLTKMLSGSIDDIIVRIERRPLRSVGFSSEQSIEYSTSGSVTEARLRDIYYTKQVDYGDLSETDIGFPIDIPLENTKEIRISAKQKNGQSNESNRNLIVWGRFIKRSKDTNET